MNFSRTRIGSWLNLFAESLIGQEAEAGTIGVQIPGLLKEDGSSNNRGNVIVAILPSEAADMMAELRTPLRDLTPAEMVRRTLEIADGIVSFKTSAASGSRTVNVPLEDWPRFLDAFEEKLEDATALLEEVIRLNAAG